MHVCSSAAELSEKFSESQGTSVTDLSADVELFTLTQRRVSVDPALNAEYGRSDWKSRGNPAWKHGQSLKTCKTICILETAAALEERRRRLSSFVTAAAAAQQARVRTFIQHLCCKHLNNLKVYKNYWIKITQLLAPHSKDSYREESLSHQRWGDFPGCVWW